MLELEVGDTLRLVLGLGRTPYVLRPVDIDLTTNEAVRFKRFIFVSMRKVSMIPHSIWAVNKSVCTARQPISQSPPVRVLESLSLVACL
jgi:hypothetical protein